MKIGIDLDDTLACCIKYFLKFYNNKHSSEFALKDVNVYEMWDVFGKSKQSVMDYIAEFYAHPIMNTLTPVKDSVQIVQGLQKDHELYVITARPSYLEDKTKKWIETHYGLCFKDIILTDQVFEKGNAVTKSDICNSLGAKLMIEDSMCHAYDCASNDIDALLLDMPWNQDYNANDRIIKVYSWKDIEKEVKKYEKITVVSRCLKLS